MDMLISDKFETLISNKNTMEREVHAFLKRYPYALLEVVNHAWNFYAIFPEFRVGTDYRADFVVISADSGSWHVQLIELEGPNDLPYRRDKTPAVKLNKAISQNKEWREFVERHPDQMKHECAKLIKPLDVPSMNYLMSDNVSGDIEISHINTYVDYEYFVVIGRSKNFTNSDQTAHTRLTHDERIMTYDRVLNAMREVESRFDSFEKQEAMLSRSEL